MFSIRFGPKLIEAKTLISNSCAVLKYHAGKRHRVIWEELTVNEGFRENEKKKEGLDFSALKKDHPFCYLLAFYMPPIIGSLPPQVFNSGKINEHSSAS